MRPPSRRVLAFILAVACIVAVWRLYVALEGHDSHDESAETDEISEPTATVETTPRRARSRFQPTPFAAPQKPVAAAIATPRRAPATGLDRRPARPLEIEGPPDRGPRAEPPACDGETARGRCDGTSVVLCWAGAVRVIDCAAHGLGCRITDEGAACEPAPPPCPADRPRCDGDVLEVCLPSGPKAFDCSAYGAECEVTDTHAHCVRVFEREEEPVAPAGEEECGACGCPRRMQLPVERVLTLQVAAFVVHGGPTPSPWGDERRVRRELALANVLLEPAGVRLRLRQTRWVDYEPWRILEHSELIEILTDDGIQEPIPTILPVIRILFVDEMWHGPVPRLAVFTRTPEHRAIVITPDRYWTTTAHEVGHALGLAHTHADRVPILERYEWPDGHLDCLGCRLEGDGICDTPPDPGRAVCTYSYPECQPICDGDWAPDVTNVMSYYTDCRQGFTPEQAGRMRQGLVRLFVERQAQRRAER